MRFTSILWGRKTGAHKTSSSPPVGAQTQETGVCSALSLCDLPLPCLPRSFHLPTPRATASQALPSPTQHSAVKCVPGPSPGKVLEGAALSLRHRPASPSCPAEMPPFLSSPPDPPHAGLCPPPAKSTELEVDNMPHNCMLNPTCRALG